MITVYQVDNSNNDVVIYWTMTGIMLYRIDSSMIDTHQLHLASADMIPGEFFLY